VIQHWRIITVEAIFKTNDCIESNIYAHISSSLNELENTLLITFPEATRTTTKYFHFSGDEIQQGLTDIFKQARGLSYAIQHDFEYCRLVVTNASNGTDGYGTYAFGLDKFSDRDEQVLLKAEMITDDRIQSFM
jgi:hypothetical protein